MNPILKLVAAGTPIRWIDYEKAAYYVTKGLVQWSYGDESVLLHGGTNRDGAQSTLTLPSIMAIKGPISTRRGTPRLEKRSLLRRDRYMCAYCGNVFKECDLQMEHIVPDSRGGEASWMNLVAACGHCNSRKANKTPEEAKMKLLYVPYVPNLHEGLILEGRRIMADQMNFLMQGVPKHSRLHLS